jgi:hypothetical protein
VRQDRDKDLQDDKHEQEFLEDKDESLWLLVLPYQQLVCGAAKHGPAEGEQEESHHVEEGVLGVRQ